jgi:hypothetical protein
MVALKLRGARVRAAAKRKDYKEGRVPFGFHVVKRDDLPVRMPEPTEQATIARIKELRGHGVALVAITQTLMSESRKPRASERWHEKQVARILSR